jgi:hypothetical protein
MPSGGSTAVEQSPRHSRVKGLSPVAVAVTGRVIMAKYCIINGAIDPQLKVDCSLQFFSY